MNSLYDYLVKNKTKTISDHELSRWPTAQVEELKNKNHLRKGENSNSIYCDSCDESCPIDDYEITEIPGKGQMAAFVCPEKDEMGFQMVRLSRRRQWRFIRPNKRKRVPKVSAKISKTNKPQDIEHACFVLLQDGIAFFSKGDFRKLPFRPNSQVLNILPNLIDGSMTSKEIQQYAGSTDKPRSIVQNINRSILSRLHKAEFLHINNSKFVCFNEINNSYQIKPQIITEEQYNSIKDDLSKKYYGG